MFYKAKHFRPNIFNALGVDEIPSPSLKKKDASKEIFKSLIFLKKNSDYAMLNISNVLQPMIGETFPEMLIALKS